MIEKTARDVSNKLNATVSRDFEDMVGIEAHDTRYGITYQRKKIRN